MRRIFQYSLIIVFSLLTACSKPEHELPYISSPTRGLVLGAASGAAVGSLGGLGAPIGAAIGGIAGTVIGYDYSQREPEFVTLQHKLDYIGVQFVRKGEDQRIIIPASRLFYTNSPRMKPVAADTLKLVIDYMKHYQFLSVTVAGYTDDIGAMHRNHVLSQAQAENVADYLWRSDFDKRMVFATGFGEEQPIADNHSKLGRAYNRRIEINFRVMPTHIG